ncbi:MAG: hypothetical protein JXA60_12230 [Candidatus Coatesbacteria bacterium]|nr:hypothetical protein [Candidatus Coatesbacteria bacterium]
MKKITLKERVSYYLDDFFSRNPYSQIIGLVVLSVIIILFGAVGIRILADAKVNGSASRAIWYAFTHLIDPGAIASHENPPLGFLFVVFFITLLGILLMSLLIGLLTSQIESRISELKKGKTFVIESNHTLIIGWNNKIFTIVEELIRANENQASAKIVILADEDKETMEDAVKLKIDDFKTTKVIFRSGDPIDLASLEMVNFNETKAILIIGDEESNRSALDSDTRNLKVIMAILNHPNRRTEPFQIIVEVQNEENIQLFETLGKEVEIVFSCGIISRIVVQTARQSGLSLIYEHLLSFEGSEFYFVDVPKELSGKTYYSAMFAIDNGTLIGLVRNGKHKLNPPDEEIIRGDDRIIIMMEDDYPLKISYKSPPVLPDESKLSVDDAHIPERFLLVNWSREIAFILQQLDQYVSKGSSCLIFSEQEEEFANKYIKEVVGDLNNLNIEYKKGSPIRKKELLNIDPISFTSIIILSDQLLYDNLESSDAKTLIVLLILREIMQQYPERRSEVNISSEILSIKNKELATISAINDFIVSNKLISMIFSQISENRSINQIFRELFNPEGYEIYLKPVSYYLPINKTATFAELIASAKRRGDVALGIIQNTRKENNIRINLNKDEKFIVKDEDKVIALSE